MLKCKKYICIAIKKKQNYIITLPVYLETSVKNVQETVKSFRSLHDQD